MIPSEALCHVSPDLARPRAGPDLGISWAPVAQAQKARMLPDRETPALQKRGTVSNGSQQGEPLGRNGASRMAGLCAAMRLRFLRQPAASVNSFTIRPSGGGGCECSMMAFIQPSMARHRYCHNKPHQAILSIA